MSLSKQTPIYSFTVAFFLYATMLVDLYRKMIGVNTTMVRNIVYIISLGLILWDMQKKKKVVPMMLMGVVMTVLFFFSSLINAGYDQVYFTAWTLFVFRLWPAYYIGRYTYDWAAVSVVVRKFLWIAVIYAVIAYLSPYDNSGETNAYATISTNLFFVVIIACYDSFTNRKRWAELICILCFIPILFLGTRACLFGAVFALMLIFGRKISQSSGQKKIRYYSLLFIGGVAVIILFTAMTDVLLDLLPNSRTLQYFVKGEMFDDSSRSESFYSRLVVSLQENPLKMHGFLGDQIFLAGQNASINEILASYSHNVYLELCMNFGVIIGIVLSITFTIVLLKAYRKSRYADYDIEYVYLGVLGMTFVNMLVSFSWLHAYEVWFLFGLSYCLIRREVTDLVPDDDMSED